MMTTKHVFYCENSLEGIFSAVYMGWSAKVGHENVSVQVKKNFNLEFFCTYHNVETNLENAEKVLRTIKKQLGNEITECICYAAYAEDIEKGTAIYRTLVDCLSVNGVSFGKRKLENLRNPSVRKVVELHRTVWNEYHHYLGFVRFKQITDQVLFGTITPKHDILVLLQEHFADRFSQEYWIIYDNKRKKALLHIPLHPCFIYAGDERLLDELSDRQDVEQDYSRLFQIFCHSISINERNNLSLQRQNLPLRFRNHMVEFMQNNEKKC